MKRLNTDLWQQWQSRYLQSLKARSKWQHNYSVNDVVLLKDETIPHRSWPLARVMKTFPGDDGVVRVVEVLCQGRLYKRAVDRLILLVADQPPPGSMSRPTRTLCVQDKVSSNNA